MIMIMIIIAMINKEIIEIIIMGKEINKNKIIIIKIIGTKEIQSNKDPIMIEDEGIGKCKPKGKGKTIKHKNPKDLNQISKPNR